MVLYHISFNLLHNGHFKPRVCNSRLDIENSSVPRVSAAKSIDGALTGMPGGNENLHLTLADHFGLMKIFKIDTEKLGIATNSIINSDELFLKEYVPDACISEEVWITEEFQVPDEDQKVVFCTNDYEIREFMPIFYSDLKLFENKTIPLQVANKLNEAFLVRPDCQHFTHLDEDAFDQCFKEASGGLLTTTSQSDSLAITELGDIFFGRIEKDRYTARIHNAKYKEIDEESFFKLFECEEKDYPCYTPIDCSGFYGASDPLYSGVAPLSACIDDLGMKSATECFDYCKKEQLMLINF